MRTRFGHAALVLLLSLSPAACGAEDGPVEPAGAGAPADAAPESAKPTRSPKPPKSPEDFLDLAEKAMAAEEAWTFSVEGRESLTFQGRRSGADYRATVRRAMEPEALHSKGVSTSSKGSVKNEELYVLDGTAYLKEGGAAWKSAPASDPGMQNKAEDLVAAVEEFRAYARTAGDDVTLTAADGTVRLRVGSGRQALTAVRDRPWVKKAVREFESTARQLRDAGIPADDARLTLSGLEEVLVLDARTYRVESHRFEFGLLLPHGGRDIVYELDVRQENRGVFDGTVELPAGVR
ncbi:hypothetical protein GCM10010406_39680 [Streptomyces thermolineatus]|uniref:Lipoprotein n=1 Tax=Streptomyces thermolineatus TaxID=44033 RepID=A0ABN3MC01_9ACTN